MTDSLVSGISTVRAFSFFSLGSVSYKRFGHPNLVFWVQFTTKEKNKGESKKVLNISHKKLLPKPVSWCLLMIHEVGLNMAFIPTPRNLNFYFKHLA